MSPISEGYMMGEVVSVPVYKRPGPGSKPILRMRLRGTNPFGALVWNDVLFVGDMADAWKATAAMGDVVYVMYAEHSIAASKSHTRGVIRNVKVALDAVLVEKSRRIKKLKFDVSPLVAELDPTDIFGIEEGAR